MRETSEAAEAVGGSQRGDAEGEAVGRRRDVVVPSLFVAAGTLALYYGTVMPGVGVWDTAEFQAIGPVLGIAHPTGYPSYTLLAWFASVVLQPFGDEAFRANLLSAILAALATGATTAAVTIVTRRALLGVASGVALALAPVAWRIGLRADAHALHFALVAVLLLLLVGWASRERAGEPSAGRWLLGAAFVFGVSLGNHALTFLLAPGIALFMLIVSPRLVVRRPRLVVGCAFLLAATTVALYAYIPIRSAMDPPLDYADPESWERFRYLVFGEQFRGTFRDFPPIADALGTVRDEIVGNLGVLALLAVVGAAATLVRRFALFVLTASWFVIPFVFALGYENADLRRYYLVPILVAAVWAGFGLEAIVSASRRFLAVDLDPALRPQPRRALAAALGIVLLLGPTLLILPQRYREVDASDEVWARQWLDAAQAAIPADAVVVSWWGFSTPLWYGQFVEGERRDMLVLDDRTILDLGLGGTREVIDRYRGERPVVLIRLGREIDALRQDYPLSRLAGLPGWGSIWEVGPQPSTGTREGVRDRG